MYRSLLVKLLKHVPEPTGALDSVIPGSWDHDFHQWSIESLKAVFTRAVLGFGQSSLVCFIDALDECDDMHQVRDLISYFEELCDKCTSGGTSFRVCFSSRKCPEITTTKGKILVLETEKGHRRDIASYLKSTLNIQEGPTARQIQADLQDKAGGVFLWAVLAANILNKELDKGRVHVLQQRVRDMPNDLCKLFRDILLQGCSSKDETLLCFQWILFAKQPLKPEQLYFAILSGFKPDILHDWSLDMVTTSAMLQFISNSSMGLAMVTESQVPTIQFIHKSVEDFLLQEDGIRQIWHHLGESFQGQSHERLKQCCVNYISIDANAKIGSLLSNAFSQQAVVFRQLAEKKFPFLEYAIQNVLYHANVAQGVGVNQITFLQTFCFPHWTKLNNLLEQYDNGRHTTNASTLYIMAKQNLANLIGSHPSKLSCFKEEGERYGAPMLAALTTNSDAAVRAFLKARVEIEPPTSPLHELYEKYCQSGGKHCGLYRGFQFSPQRGILSHISKECDQAIIISYLLASDRPDAFDGSACMTALSWATKRGHEVVVKFLLDSNMVNPDSKECLGGTPLSLAASNGHETVAQLLLNTGKVDINTKDNIGQTPLLQAAKNGHGMVVKLLLETSGIDAESTDKDGRTPLWWAAENGHKAVMEQLIEASNVGENAAANSGNILLSWAAEKGHESIVELLLGTGIVKVDSKDTSGRTPLLLAAKNGHEPVARLLLQLRRIDVDSKDDRGRTPLCWAVVKGYTSIVKLLLESGKVNANLEDDHGRTPLSWAAEHGREAEIKLLLDIGRVDADLRDDSGPSPLSYAVIGTRNHHLGSETKENTRSPSLPHPALQPTCPDDAELQPWQKQLILLEQENKKRLAMARQEARGYRI
ncbi:nacht and ankyrin domain-containing protein [Pochonia chlamydosporia 170]|uniref:Nacht and ankyrin domain-containing protein n=1 Tax=Pochonia chlamydosporia 170 TaxID=1380566 RepID=A0A179F4B6_METCM|nr:nacht and ankyrin domain-containing protein [Pochonia chlamydosporia 170]OAQ60264.1 nacht and ankyrin domain-containing protein [Pochonia chlamydosporia 170]